MEEGKNLTPSTLWGEGKGEGEIEKRRYELNESILRNAEAYGRIKQLLKRNCGQHCEIANCPE